MSGEDEGTDKKGFRLLWILDVQKVPCAREAVLYGAGGSAAAGLLHFLVTSRVRRSYHVGFAGFFFTTLGTWFYCRFSKAKQRVQERMILQGIQNRVMYQGTRLDPTSQQEVPLKLLDPTSQQEVPLKLLDPTSQQEVPLKLPDPPKVS